MKQITDNLIAVLVPDDVTWVNVSDIDNAFIKSTLDINSILQYGKEKTTYYNPNNMYLPLGDWKTVGLIQQSGQFDFDFNSTIMDVWEYGLESKKTFLSLLNSKGIFLDQLQNQKILILEKA